MSEINKRKQIEADLMLLFVTLSWGVSYITMDWALMEISPFTLNAYRFGGAFVIAILIGFKKLKGVNKKTIKYSFFIGTALFVVYFGCTYGVLYTSLSNAGFLVALPVVTTPIIAYFFKGVKPDKKFKVVLCTSVIGIGLLTLNGNFQVASGDLLCILAAVAYGVDLNITETAVSHEDVDAFQLGVFQLGFTAIYCIAFSVLMGEFKFPTEPRVIGSTIFLAIFCTGIAFIVQAIAQQYTTASHVGVIFTLEPVFAGIVAFFVAGEVLTFRAYLGAIILVASLFIMEIDFGKLKKKENTIK